MENLRIGAEFGHDDVNDDFERQQELRWRQSVVTGNTAEEEVVWAERSNHRRAASGTDSPGDGPSLPPQPHFGIAFSDNHHVSSGSGGGSGSHSKEQMMMLRPQQQQQRGRHGHSKRSGQQQQRTMDGAATTGRLWRSAALRRRRRRRRRHHGCFGAACWQRRRITSSSGGARRPPRSCRGAPSASAASTRPWRLAQLPRPAEPSTRGQQWPWQPGQR